MRVGTGGVVFQLCNSVIAGSSCFVLCVDLVTVRDAIWRQHGWHGGTFFDAVAVRGRGNSTLSDGVHRAVL